MSVRQLGRFLGSAVLLGAAVLVTGCVSGSGGGGTAVTTGAVNIRSGPGTQFSILTSVPGGTVLTLYGCLEDGSWCDTSTVSDRGWVSARYLSISQAAYAPVAPIYPVVSFGFWGDSWDYGGGGGFRRNDPL